MATYVKLKTIDEGQIVRLQESGIYKDFIVLKKGYPDNTYNNVLLVRRYAYDDRIAWDNDSLQHNDHSYDVGSLDVWMQNYVSKFSAAIQNYMQTVPLQILDGGANNGSLKKTIYRKAFALSATEVGFGPADGTNPIEGSKIPYLDTATRRVCYLEGGGSVSWLLRSRNAKTAYNPRHYCWRVDANGDYGNECWQYAYYYPRPAFCLPEDITVQTYANAQTLPIVIANMPPSVPTELTAPASSLSSVNFDLSWFAATDTDGGMVYYRIERSFDSGSTWATFASGIRTTTYATSVPYKLCSEAQFRVVAYDGTYLNESVATPPVSVSIINNAPPQMPVSIAANGNRQGDPVRIVWGKASDEDNNLAGYRLQRKVGDEPWTTIYEAENAEGRTYQDTDTDNVTSVTYRVCAFDTYGAESSYRQMSAALTILEAVSLTLEHNSTDAVAEGAICTDRITYTDADNITICSSISDKTLHYTFRTNDNESPVAADYSIKLLIDGNPVTTTPTSFEYFSETSSTAIAFTVPQATWLKLLAGAHTVKCTIEDVDGNAAESAFSFCKDVTGAMIESDILKTQTDITHAAITVLGNYNQSDVHVLVTNNAGDATPMWQEVPWTRLNNGSFFSISNTHGDCTKFALKIVCTRSGDTTCWISGINGTIGKNYFAMLESRISALENA